MQKSVQVDIALLYAGFHTPITDLDCGKRCAPYNDWGVPFCCDTRHTVPTAYEIEWDYLCSHTDLWHLWEGQNLEEVVSLRKQTPQGQVLIECLGAERCQREFRAITCRAFPFFPYITLEGEFIGLSYYWEYEDCCWIISNLQVVSSRYLQEFLLAFETLFDLIPEERVSFHHHSRLMRQVFRRKKRAIPLLHRNRNCYKITPRNGRLRRVPMDNFPMFGHYKLAADLPFPDGT